MAYQVLDLGQTFPWRINNQGVIVGAGAFTGTVWNAASWQHWGINEGGDRCGVHVKYVGTEPWYWQKSHGFVRQANGAILDIGPLIGEDQDAYSYLFEINNQGVAVGSRGPSIYPQRAIAFDMLNPASVSDLSIPAGWLYSQAQGINDNGDIVGVASDAAAISRIFCHRNGQFHDLGPAGTLVAGEGMSMIVPVTEGGRISAALPRGQTDSEAAIYDLNGSAQWQRLGVLAGARSSVARDANDSDQVVGYCHREDGVRHAFLWWPAGGMQDLHWHLEKESAKGWLLESATGINEAGHIVGLGKHWGIQSGFKLIPWSQSPDLERWKMFERIIAGIIQDGGGIVLTPKGPIPVPPWGPLMQEEWAALDVNQRDAVIALAILQASSAVGDEKSQDALRRTAGVVLGRALEKINAGARGDATSQWAALAPTLKTDLPHR